MCCFMSHHVGIFSAFAGVYEARGSYTMRGGSAALAAGVSIQVAFALSGRSAAAAADGVAPNQNGPERPRSNPSLWLATDLIFDSLNDVLARDRVVLLLDLLSVMVRSSSWRLKKAGIRL